MLTLDAADQASLKIIQRSEQGDRAVADIVMRLRTDMPDTKRQTRLRAFQGLNLAFLMVSRSKEFHLQPLAEPYVSLSTHTAPVTQSSLISKDMSVHKQRWAGFLYSVKPINTAALVPRQRFVFLTGPRARQPARRSIAWSKLPKPTAKSPIRGCTTYWNAYRKLLR
jgi:hypothetical protein